MVEQTNIAARRRRLAGRQQNADGDEAAAGLEAFLAAHMRLHASTPGRTKRSAARLALVAAIRDGQLQPGGMLPPEKALTGILGVSLGTVQAALRQLQQAGTIVRRRGDGSRVASVEPLADAIWHFRFNAKATGQPMRFVRQAIAVDTVTVQGPWADFLGRAEAFVRIRRRMAMSAGARIFAEMYLDAALAPGLADIDPRELEMVNIRPFLEENYGLFTAGARHTISTTVVGQKAATQMGLERGQRSFEIHAKAFTAERSPVYFQRIFARCSDCVLDF
ncbi:MAG: GntR family transcriptional regulator [Hyphomicrobiaceae bacterium]